MSPLSMKSTEIRVGLFIVAALAVITAFLLILADVQFTKGFMVQAEFGSSLALREGAVVRVSGLMAGKVKLVEYLEPGQAALPGLPDRPNFVRATLELEPAFASTIRRDTSRFLITTKGMLGDTYVEVNPGTEGPFIEEGDILQGQLMTPMEDVTAEVGALMDQVSTLLKDQEAAISRVIASLDELAARARDVAAILQEKAPGLLDGVDAAVEDVRVLLRRADAVVAVVQDTLADGEELQGILADLGVVTSTVADATPTTLDQAQGLLDDGRLLVADARRTLERLEPRLDQVATSADGAMTEARAALRDAREALRRTGPSLDRLPGAIARAEALLAGLEGSVPALREALGGVPAVLDGARRVTDAVAEGRGTLGALVMDRALYDDLREMLLDLKRRPWKVLWKD